MYFRFLILAILLQSHSLFSKTPVLEPALQPEQIRFPGFISLKFKHIDEKEGLSQHKIISIIQDQPGYLWLGTGDGLVRYDGYTFTTFRQDINDTASISNNIINCLFEDSRGRLWIGTDDELNLYNPATESFERFNTLDSSYSKDNPNKIFSIDEDKDGAIWTANSIGISRLIIDEGKSKLATNNNLKKNIKISQFIPDPVNVIYSILCDSRGNIWVGSFNGLMRLVVKNNNSNSPEADYQFERIYRKFGNKHPLLKTPILSLLEDHNGTIWAKTSNGLVRFETTATNQNFTTFLLNYKKYVYDRFLFNPGALLEIPGKTGSRLLVNLKEDGFAIFDPETESFERIRSNGKDSDNSTIPYYINSIYRDRGGILWFGTETGSLFKFDEYTTRFSKYNPKLNSIAYDNLIDMRFVFEDSHGNLWIANKAVYRCDRFSGKVFAKYWEDTEATDWTLKNKIEEDGKGFVWIASEFGGLYRYDPYSKKISPVAGYSMKPVDDLKISEDFDILAVSETGIRRFKINSEKKSYVNENVTALARDKKGNIWYASWVDILVDSLSNLEKGSLVINKIDVFSKKIYHYRLSDLSASIQTKVEQVIYTLYPESDERIWIGSNFGLVRFEPESGSVKFFDPYSDNSKSLSRISIHSIAADKFNPQKFLWIGTDDKGLYRFSKEDGTFKRYGSEDGLPGNTVSSILLDEKGHLWLGTDKGISKAIIDPESGKIFNFKNYDSRDGISDDDFSFFYGQNAHKNAKGELFFAGAKGITIFNPDDIKENLRSSPVVATEFYLNFHPASYGKPESPLTAPISQVKHIDLSYKNNSFAIELASLDFHAPEKKRYAYKLEGYQDKWIYPSGGRRAVFTQVPPGNYVFHAKAANSDGVWSKKELTLTISIIPPWYQTWQAYLLYAVFILTLLYLLRRYEMNRQRHKLRAEVHLTQTEKLKELDKLKSDFFANISHEFRTPLTLILGPAERLIKEKNASDKNLSLIYNNARRLLRLIDQLLDLSKLERSKLNLQASHGDFIAFLKGLVMSFESLAARKNIKLQIVSDDSSELNEAWFDRNKMEKIFFNLLSNAFKFTPDGGEVRVDVSKAASCPLNNIIPGHDNAFEVVNPRCQICLEENEAQLKTSNCVTVTVSDTGEGIPEKQLPHIFDRFYQADSSSRRIHGGTGIGLALVKELVELHYGSIIVTSKENKGTSFEICLPLSKEHLKPEQIVETADDKHSEENGSSEILEQTAFIESEVEEISSDGVSTEEDEKLSADKPIILIVEDNADVRAYIREQLHSEYTILEAKDGEEGIKAAVESIPDLVISDVMMPKKNGYEVCRTLKTDQRTSHIPVILLTAKARAEEKLAGLETGADDYILKPFSQEELAIRVKNLIELRKKLRVKYSAATSIKPSEIETTSMDREFMKSVIDSIETKMGDKNFSTEILASEVAMSVSQLNRKLNALIDQPAGKFIRSMRLQRAADLLKKKSGTIAEICYEVGFGGQANFTVAFKKQFGCTPLEYQKRN